MTLRTLERDSSRSGRAVSPDVSIVIPTHNRRALLEKALDRLAAQTVDMAGMEFIVVVDGCTDDTEEMLRSQDWPFDLRVVVQEQRGAAASRNAGARAARAPIIIFIDDDIMAAPDLVEQHLRAHRDEETTVTIGRLAPDPSPKVPGWWRWLERQLDKQYRMMQAGQRRIDGRCLYSGNFSVKREAFLRVGGFDEMLRHSEDVELGLRLEQDGATFRLALDASGEHWGYTSYQAWLDMAYRYGRWDGALAVSPEYAFPWDATFAAYRRRSRWLRLCAKRVLDHPRLFKTLVRSLRIASVVAGTLRLRVLERSFYAGIYDLTYWQGVCDEWGGARVLWRTLGRMR
jgi:GT2 family glycosyltransferase